MGSCFYFSAYNSCFLIDKRINTWYGIYSFFVINTQTDGLIIRLHDKETSNNSIYNLIYNLKTCTIKKGILLAYDYYAEGGSCADIVGY